jgi:undecaprenyl-diphosphatase
MSIIQVILLAIVQGITEFLPISSTAHLILVPWLFGWEDQGLTFDVALHAGTLLAVLVYFARDWWEILRDTCRNIFKLAPATNQTNSRLLLILVLATIPGGLAGLYLESYAESLFRSPLLIAGQLILISLVMWAADRRPTDGKDVKQTSLTDGAVIGLAQAVAIIPGTSRAGITISAGLFQGFTRESAARFSFLLSTPIIGGATLKKAYDVWQAGFPPGATPVDYILGFLVSALVGYAAIAFLLHYLQNRTLKIFVAYRMALGVIIVTIEAIRIYG